MAAGFRSHVLRRLYEIFPFNLIGDADIPEVSRCVITCIIPTFNRCYDLNIVLGCLSSQSMPRELYEVIVVEDGSTDAVYSMCLDYSEKINVKLLQVNELRHSIGYLRNRALEVSGGYIILFLDDDTRILQEDFLKILCEYFEEKPKCDSVLISGLADRSIINNKYDYLDKYSFATRCVAYRKTILREIGGFIDDVCSYEDIEMSIRYIIRGGSECKTDIIQYYHPPLYIKSFSKVLLNGLSLMNMYRRYSFPVWICCYLNALRFLPLILSPIAKQRQWAMISVGFAVAPFFKFFGKTRIVYR